MVLMEWIILVEHVEQDLGDKPVQMPEKVLEKPRKKRSIEDKVGRQKYHEVVTKQILALDKEILEQLRWIRHKLHSIGESDLDVPALEKFSAKDQVDLEIMQRLREVGVQGAFPKDIAEHVNKLGAYGLQYYDVSRRIVRMNKRLHVETGELLFEKRGHK